MPLQGPGQRVLPLIVSLALLWGSGLIGLGEEIAADPPPRWWRGNIHTHSLWSDGNDFPEMICDWYRNEGYHFLALSDHNVLSEGERWMTEATVLKRAGADGLAKYRRRFGDHWVETRQQGEPAENAIRLKPFSEYRTLVEERGRFLLIRLSNL